MAVSSVSISQADKELRKIDQNAFGLGEKLEYEVGYKFLTAGKGYMRIMPDPIMRRGRQCYDIRFQVQSLRSLEFLYKIKNQYRSVVDMKGLFPWEFEQRNREGKYKRDFKAEFDQYRNLAITKDSTYKVPEYVHDIISAFFYVRTLDFRDMKVGDIYKLQNFYDDSTYTLGVKYRGKETVKVDAGEFRCLVVEPMVSEGGLFKHEGSLVLYLTDDERRIPVKIATKILIGYVEARLVKYENANGPVKAKL